VTVAMTTKRSRFLPYRFFEHALDLSVEHCAVDGVREAVLPYDAEHRLVDLSASRFATVRLGVAMSVASEILDGVLPADERRAPEARVIVTITCAATRLRRAVMLVDGPVTAGVLRAELELSTRDMHGTVTLEPVMVRRTGRPLADDGFAALAGSRLADGRRLEIRIDALRPPHGNYLDIRYESFRTKGAPQFPHPHALYQLECDGDEPLLWLNLDHAHVCSIFDGAGNVGRVARVRNVVFAQISQAVWTRLFWRAARSVHVAGEAVRAWEDAVLAHLLPRVYPDVRNHGSRLAALRADLDSHGDDAVMARLDGALQNELEVAACADSLAQELA